MYHSSGDHYYRAREALPHAIRNIMTIKELKTFTISYRNTMGPFKQQSSNIVQENKKLTDKVFEVILKENPELKGDVTISVTVLMDILSQMADLIQNDIVLSEGVDATIAILDTISSTLEQGGIPDSTELFRI